MNQQIKYMNWENCETILEDKKAAKIDTLQSGIRTQDKHTENEQKKRIQLQKLKDSNKDKCRQAYILTASKLGDWIINDNKEQNIETILADSFEAFLFNFAEISHARYVSNPTEFLRLTKTLE